MGSPLMLTWLRSSRQIAMALPIFRGLSPSLEEFNP